MWVWLHTHISARINAYIRASFNDTGLILWPNVAAFRKMAVPGVSQEEGACVKC